MQKSISSESQLKGIQRIPANQLRAAALFGMHALSNASPHAIYQEAVELVAAALCAEMCCLVELRQDTEDCILRAATNGLLESGHTERIVSDCHALTEYALLQNDPVTVEDIRTETRFPLPALLLEHDILSGIFFIVYREDGNPWGMLNVCSVMHRRFTEEDAEFVQNVANILGLFAQRNHMEAALKASEERLRLSMEAAEMGSWHWDVRTDIQIWSPRCRKLLGVAEDTPISFAVFKDRVHPDDLPQVMESIRLSVNDRVPCVLEYRVIFPDGSVRWIWDKGMTFYGPDGAPVRREGVVYDITERKQLEAQYRQAQKMEGIGQLAGGIAHDFNNLLSIILGYAELIDEDLPEESPIRVRIRTMMDAANNASDLTRQLLSFARRQLSDPKIISPNQHIENMTQMLRPLIGEDIHLQAHLDAEVGHVCIDPHQMEQLLVNLVVNARDAMPQGGTLSLRTTQEVIAENRRHPQFVLPPGAYVRLSVSDTGIGMTEEVRDRVFEPFFTTKGVGGGTGLGLASVYGIIKQHQGFIFVESAPGEGSAFHIYLPQKEGQVSAVAAVERPSAFSLAGKTILVVEDEPLLRELATLTLRKYGCNVLEAGDGVEALQVVATYPEEIHLLLTDAIMPRMGGKELAERLKPLRPTMRILLASGYAEDRFLQDQSLPPDTAFLRKPFTQRDLLSSVQAALA